MVTERPRSSMVHSPTLGPTDDRMCGLASLTPTAAYPPGAVDAHMAGPAPWGSIMKILLSAHVCGPELGSDGRLGWYLPAALADLGHEVHVLTHADNQPAVVRAPDPHPTNLHVHFVEPPRLARRAGEASPTLRHRLWQRAAERYATELDGAIDVDVVHHLTGTDMLAGSRLWRLAKPFVIGPVRGGDVAPSAFRASFATSSRSEAVRRVMRPHVAPLLASVRNPMGAAHLVVATNPASADIVAAAGARRIVIDADAAVGDDLVSDLYPARAADDVLNVLWCGRMQPVYGLSLALDALALVRPNCQIRLRLVGSDRLSAEVEAQVSHAGICHRVDNVGRVGAAELTKLMFDSDVMLATALRDVTSSRHVLEALATGLPVIGLDHHAVGALLQPAWGVPVPVEYPRTTAAGIGRALERMHDEPDTRQAMGEAAWRNASRHHTWAARALAFDGHYRQIVYGR